MSTRGWTWTVIVLLVLLIGSVLGFEVRYANRIYPGVSVWGVYLGGMRPEGASPSLESFPVLDEQALSLRGPDRTWGVSPRDMGVRLDSTATLARAYQLGRNPSGLEGLVHHLELLVIGADVAPVLIFDESKARLLLEALGEEINVAPRDARLAFEGITPVIEPSRVGRLLDVDATLASVSPAAMALQQAELPLVMREMRPTIRDAESARAEAERLLGGPVTLTIADPREGDPGPWVISVEQLVGLLDVRAKDGVLEIGLNADAVDLYLEKLAPALEVEPVNARFHFDEATNRLVPITESEDGRALDVSASVERIIDAVQGGNRFVSLAVEDVAPRYPDTATAEELGIVDLVATGESYFIGSPSGRDHNIRLAATKFDGLVIPPGETFSFNHYLGEVTAEAGYDESYITAGEQLAMGIGGGICQVSTTAFRAAFWGGYPITERWYHGQRVGYYELHGGGVGMDATVYSPHVDLKFVNDRSAPLLIETEVGEESHRLVFRLYSTDDGRRVEKEGPSVTDERGPGPPIYELDEEMTPGTMIKWQSPVGGLTATVERRVYDAGGELLHEDTFISDYQPRRAAYHYGPGYEPPGEETEP